MNFKPQREEEEVGINLVPLIDCLLVLLIFFMVSTRFDKNSAIELSLPQASREADANHSEVIDVAIDRRGQFFVNGKALVNTQAATLRQALQDARPADKQPVVVISADEQATHQAVITVMDAAHRVGLNHITFPTQLKTDE